MIEQHVLNKVYEYADSCLDYIGAAKDMRAVMKNAIEIAEPYIQRDAILQAAENLDLPNRHNEARFSVRAALAMYASKEFREATDAELPDQEREAIEGINRVVESLESVMKMPGVGEPFLKQAAEWIEQLSVRAYNLRGGAEMSGIVSDEAVEALAKLLIDDWLKQERIQIPGYAVSKDDGIWSQGVTTARRYLSHVAPLVASAAWADGHESGFWNGRESAGSGEMELCGVEHAKANNPYKKEAE